MGFPIAYNCFLNWCFRPVMGFNSNKGINKNLMLHSFQIKFKINEIKHTYSALLPNYFKKLLKSKRLRFSNLK